MQQIDDKQWQQKLANYTERIEQMPKNPDHHLDRGHFFLQHGKPELAIVDYSTAIDLDPNRFESYNSRGVAYSEQKKFRQALNDLNKAISISPTTAIIYVNRAIAYCLKDDYERGFADYNHAIRLWMDLPGYPQQLQRWRAYHNRAIAYRRLDRGNESLQDMLRAMTLAPAQHCLHIDLAKLYRQYQSGLLFDFFDKKLSLDDIDQLAKLHQQIGEEQGDVKPRLKSCQNLINIYCQTTRGPLITSLRFYHKQLLREKNK